MIRLRRDEDLSSCVDAMSDVHRVNGYPSNWPADPLTFLSPSDLLDAWVAVDGTGVTGHVLLRDGAGERAEIGAADVELPGALASVSRLFITPAAQGAGLAAKLLTTATETATRRGLGVILSVVDDGNSAIGMYERLGWRHFATRAAEWNLPDDTVPLMRYYRQPVLYGPLGVVAR